MPVSCRVQEQFLYGRNYLLYRRKGESRCNLRYPVVVRAAFGRFSSSSFLGLTSVECKIGVLMTFYCFPGTMRLLR